MEQQSGACSVERSRTRDGTDKCERRVRSIVEHVARLGLQGGVRQPGISADSTPEHAAQQHGHPGSEQ